VKSQARSKQRIKYNSMSPSKPKPKLPEDEGSFFAEVKVALAMCEEHLNEYSKEKAKAFLSKYAVLWTEVHFTIVCQVLRDFNLEDSSLVLFHDRFMELNTKVDYDGLPME
jgi:hypothetical protein